VYWPQGCQKKKKEKKKKWITIEFGKSICNPWDQTTSQKILKVVAPSFFSPDSECKAGQSSSASKMSSFQLQDVFYRLSVARQRLYLEDYYI
jgi:hypothetical protein